MKTNMASHNSMFTQKRTRSGAPAFQHDEGNLKDHQDAAGDGTRGPRLRNYLRTRPNVESHS
jgi:hypothetical protein